jgi:hypothetical protein
MTEAGGSLSSQEPGSFPFTRSDYPMQTKENGNHLVNNKIIIAHAYAGSFYMTNDIGDHRQR